MRKPTQRLPDWQIRLGALVRSLAGRPYAWGEFDCCTLAADVALAVTGVDPMADLRGAYSTEQGAVRVLARLGGLEAALDARLGPRVPVAFAQAGDIGLGGDSGTAAIFFGGAVWHAAADVGLTVVQAPAFAWRCHV